MINDLWLNLPVSDLKKSKDFFAALGFSFKEHPGSENEMVCMPIGDRSVVVNLFKEPTFRSFTNSNTADPKRGVEVLFSLGAQTRGDVDALLKKAAAAGGTVYGGPGEKDGWMYGGGFVDLDGHRWNVLHMDMSKLPAKK